MKYATRFILFIFLAVLIALALPSGAQAKDAADDKVIFGDTYTLSSGQTQNGNLAVLGGTATLEADSQVNGDVALMGGTLEINGTVSGNVSTLGGTLFLNDNAVIRGDVTMMGGTLHRSANARISGSLINGVIRPFQLDFPNWPLNINWPGGFRFTPIWNFFSSMFSSLLLAALAVFVVLLWPRPVDRVARSMVAQPAISGGLGLLTVVVTPALLILLAITIILIPLSLLGILVLGIGLLLGWIALGQEIGNRIAGMFKQQWNPALSAGLGTLVLNVVAYGINWIPCIGWLVVIIAALIGLGGVIVTRFGTQIYPASLAPAPAYAAPSYPAAPPAPASPSIEPTPGIPPVEPPASGEDQNPTN